MDDEGTIGNLFFILLRYYYNGTSATREEYIEHTWIVPIIDDELASRS